MNQTEIAKILGVSRTSVYRCVKNGMPTTDVVSAKKWFDEKHLTQSEGVKKYYSEHPEVAHRLREARRNVWQEHPEKKVETYARVSKSLQASFKKHPERNVIISERQKRWFAEHPDEAKRIEGIAMAAAWKKNKGGHNYGRVALGNLNHLSARKWTVQSPDGKSYTFNNLIEWCRKNEGLFGNECGDYKHPLHVRMANGLRGLACNGKANRNQHKGWIVISVKDIER